MSINVKRYLYSLKNPEGKNVMKNLSYLSLLQVANYIFPLITLPYLARVVGVDAFGLLAVGTSVIAYFQTLIDYGFNYTTVKEIARNKNDKPLINMIVMETMLARIILLVLSFTLIFLGIAFVPYLYENRIIILSTSTILVGYAFMLDWYFQAIEDMKFITLVNLVSNLVFTLSVFIFIHSPKDYFIQPLLTSAGTLVASFLCWIIIFRKYGLNLSIPSFYLAMARIKKGFNMFISLFLPTIYTNLNVLLLGAYNGTCATGIYSGGAKFTGIAYRITMLFSRVFYPFLSRRMDKHSVYAIVSILIGFLISIFFFFGSDLLVQLFLGDAFSETITVLRIVSFTPLAISIFNVYGTNYLAIKCKDSILRNIVIGTTILGLFFGVFGAIYYSYIGVAACSLLTQSVRALAAFIFAKIEMKKSL